MFLEKELMINIIEHDIVPEHKILTPEEKLIFYEEYSCKKKNLPRILNTDPVAKYYNMKPGDICKIIRVSEVSGSVFSYRIVTKGYAK